MDVVEVGNVKFSNNLPFVFIGGPCQVESEDNALMIADFLVNLTSKLNIPYVFKASFDKANRTSVNSKRGIAHTDIIDWWRRPLTKKTGKGISDITDFYKNMVRELAEMGF